MRRDDEQYRNYCCVLKEELIPAMGCTEPIAIAYAAATAYSLFENRPAVDHIQVNCSGNMIKNVKGVTVPNSNGLKGIDAAAILGITGGRPENALEVLNSVTDRDREAAKQLQQKKICKVSLAEDVPSLYIQVIITAGEHTAEVVISFTHTHIEKKRIDDRVIINRRCDENISSDEKLGNVKKMSLKGIVEFADLFAIEDLKDVLDRQIEYNSSISQEGLTHSWGVKVGKTILAQWGDNVKSRAIASAASGSDARMSGCPMPVVINSGSGNQGITVTMPILAYAKEWNIGREKCYRALVISNLISIYIKHYIGPLSAFCGAVSAATGAGCAITYMAGGGYEKIASTVTNTLANVGGVMCDGAKPSCAGKIAIAVQAALLAHYMSMNDEVFAAGEGIVEDDVETTIRNMGYIGKVGMKDTDREILNVMTDQVDVDQVLSDS